MGAFDSRDNFDYSGALARTLESGVPVTLYYGKTDTACNYKGGEALANTIQWSGRDAFAALPLTSLEIAGVEAGQQKSYGGLTFIQVLHDGGLSLSFSLRMQFSFYRAYEPDNDGNFSVLLVDCVLIVCCWFYFTVVFIHIPRHLRLSVLQFCGVCCCWCKIPVRYYFIIRF